MLFGLFARGGATFKPETDIPDLGGKVVLVTGGTHLSSILIYDST